MAQQQATLNFLIHDTNGNPQYIKVQGANKVVKAIPQEAVKTILSQKSGTVAQVVNAGSGTVVSQSGQVLRTLSIQKPRQLVTIPVQTPIPSLIKTERNPVTSKTVQLSSSQSVVIQANSSPKTYVTSLLDHTGLTRKRQENENDFIPEFSSSGTKRRKTEKGGKGLRHFSMKVCEKVRKKGTTSYNEVADELVAEFTNPNLVPNSVDQQYDQKNIRRRVYDALNVLMAMNIISKEKKEIRWLGLPTNSQQECVSLVTEKNQIANRIKEKTQQLNDLLLQQISYKKLIQRNFEVEKVRGAPPPNTVIHLPFVVVNSDRKTIIDCSITNDKTEYLFVFNDKFEIEEDFDVLKHIGLTMGLDKGTISDADLANVKSMLPKSMEKYITKMAVEKGCGDGEEGDMDEDGRVRGCAGPSSEHSVFLEEHDSTLGDTSDDESNLSTDIEVN